MFGGKREKQLEEELAAVKAQRERNAAALEGIFKKREDTAEQFASMTASRAQMQKHLEAAEEEMRGAEELIRQAGLAADEVYSALIEGKNCSETFRANHTIFVDSVKEQNGQIAKLAENSRDMAERMEAAAALPAELAGGFGQMNEEVAQMLEFSRNMSVLALNAAIEAGRMGEVGSRFIGAAEEVRSFADQYVRAAERIGQQLSLQDEKQKQLEEKIQRLEETAKQQQELIADIQKNSIRTIASYETGQIDVRTLIPEESAARADALKQAHQEFLRCKERLMEQMGHLKEELSDQKACAGEVEQSFAQIGRMAENAVS